MTYFEVAALCKDCPVEDIVAQIGQALPGARVSAIRQVVESRKAAVEQLRRLGFGEQILDLFSSLHARGKTVLMVTHNPANLVRATRSLRMRDGRVEEDRPLRFLPAEPVTV